jgi:hypothetical protein
VPTRWTNSGPELTTEHDTNQTDHPKQTQENNHGFSPIGKQRNGNTGENAGTKSAAAVGP